MTQQWPGIPTNVNDYENPWTAAIIMNGKIYYNSPQYRQRVRSVWVLLQGFVYWRTDMVQERH